jgi:hypothetical protein
MIGAIALFLFGSLTALLSLDLPLGTLRAPGSGLFPLVLGLALMGLALTQAVLLRHSAPPTSVGPASSASTDGAKRRVVLFMGAVALATALLAPLGYVAVAFLLMLALLRVLGFRSWYGAALIGLVSAAACEVIFVYWLKIPLPSGLLGL